MTTNFDLAPPPAALAGGGTAVPIDIASIDAHLTFDAAAQAAHGTASLAFVVGPAAGRPVFDLRQTITEVVLDGLALPVTAVPGVDLGGGPGAEVRVLDAVLASGTGHTLAVGYDVGPPASPPGGGYPPHLVWSGPAGARRLRWNTGFTDLAPARYLESWVPANLIWDQYAVAWEVTITGTTVAHTLITNGAVTTLGPNHWSVAFPGRSTALSTLIEVRPADEFLSRTAAVALPAAGRTIMVEAWTTRSSGIDLAAALADLSAWLVEDDSQIGPYLHGDRFVTFLLQGGMEYDGGCTAIRGTLRHEAFHSWWGRGVKPAGQPDGWIDEAWNTYHDNGAATVDPFDFAEPAQTLCSREPYSRVTPGASYAGGARVFAGIAALSSPPALTAAMSGFYRAHADQLITTLTLEEHLAAGIGAAAPDVVDGFHHFVYGFADPSPSPDLWLRDDPGHTGSELWAGRFWDSPDLWIRHADDGGTVHQAPIAGQDNWFHARIRNQGAGAARHFMVMFNVRQYSGVEFAWPSDYLPAIAAAGGFDLDPGQEVVVRARWPAALVPPAGTHACWLAGVLSRADRPVAGAYVWEHGNLAQKNLTIHRARPGQTITVPFGYLAGLSRRFEVRAPEQVRHWPFSLRPKGPGPEWRSPVMEGSARPARPGRAMPLAHGQPVPSPGPRPPGLRVAAFAITVPPHTAPGTSAVIDLVARDGRGAIVGGIAVQLTVDPDAFPGRTGG
jgi:hypothetical protein